MEKRKKRFPQEAGYIFIVRQSIGWLNDQVGHYFMSNLRLYGLVFIVSFFAACSDKSHKHAKGSIPGDTNHFPNVIQVKQFGDTMRLEIEKQGDTLIRHYIDLQDTKGKDNFDNSFTAISIYQRRDVDSIVTVEKKKMKITAVLIENYETVFSNGKNCYFITQAGDTIFYQHMLGVIR